MDYKGFIINKYKKRNICIKIHQLNNKNKKITIIFWILQDNKKFYQIKMVLNCHNQIIPKIFMMIIKLSILLINILFIFIVMQLQDYQN